MLIDLFLCSLFYWEFKNLNKIFLKLEVLIFTIALYSNLSNSNISLALSCFFLFIFPFSIEILISLPFKLGLNLEIYISEFLQSLLQSKHDLLYFITTVAIFLSLLFLFYNYFINITNISRKLFHFLAFAIFIRRKPITIFIGHLIVYISIWISSTPLILKYFNFLIRRNNIKKDRFSLPILVFICVLAQINLEKYDFYRFLISLCFYDSFASFTGQILNKTKRSFEGLVVGIIVACIVELILVGYCSLIYHILVGIVEYNSIINDNIAIGTFSIMYSYIKRTIR